MSPLPHRCALTLVALAVTAHRHHLRRLRPEAQLTTSALAASALALVALALFANDLAAAALAA